MEEDVKYYQLFSVDICTCGWAMDNVLVGAENVDDLVDHLKEVFSLIDKNGKKRYYNQNLVKRIKKEKVRIQPIKNSYTTTPYTIIETYAYYE